MSLIGTLAVNVVANTAAFEAGLRNARGSLSDFSGDVESIGGGGFSGLVTAISQATTTLAVFQEAWSGLDAAIARSAEQAETMLMILETGEKRSKIDKMKEDAKELAAILGKDVLQAAANVNKELERKRLEADAEGIRKAAGADTSITGAIGRFFNSRGVDSGFYGKLVSEIDKSAGRGLGITGDIEGLRRAAEQVRRLEEAKAEAARVERDNKAAATKAAEEKKRIDEEGKALLKESERLNAEITKRYEEQQRAAEAITKSLRTPLEIYNEELSKLTELKNAGRITAETMARGLERARGIMDDAEESARRKTMKAEESRRGDTASAALGSEEAFSAWARQQNDALAGMGKTEEHAKRTADGVELLNRTMTESLNKPLFEMKAVSF